MTSSSGTQPSGFPGSSYGGSSLPALERLTGRANWSSWKFAAKTYLQLEGLWDAVKPKKKDDGTFEAVEEQKDLRAKLKIILLLDPSIYVHIEDAESAREAWDRLEQAFEDKGLARQVGLLHKLLRLTLESCTSMAEYVNEVVATSNQLNSLDFKIPSLWVGMLLLAGLPKQFKPMIMALENSGVAITGDYVKTKLLQEEDDYHHSNGKNNQAFATNKRQDRNGKQKQTPTAPKGPKCRKCNRFGHIAKDCREARKGDTFCTVLSTFDLGEADDWIFDSAAYAHMTPSKDLLESFDDGCGKVMAANGGMMDIVASGTARIWPACQKDKDGVAISDVQLIPSLTTNLLSISKIVQNSNWTRQAADRKQHWPVHPLEAWSCGTNEWAT